jgi:CcmD family protein
METPNTINSLFFAYTVVWVLIVAYLLFLNKKINKLEKQQENHFNDN